MEPQKGAHNSLALERKREIINYLESGRFTKTALATLFAVPESSLSSIGAITLNKKQAAATGKTSTREVAFI